ncbi:unnamed protein product [Nesidiocoris tenuis]|uniref:Uncharacterized protein n=1 Tax=Nesidiocoris tenuis TaxID=355587 RepID=A0A6H5GBM9_9HEMI|nr:unnamed protein product [Nesidiocoris tenuis]
MTRRIRDREGCYHGCDGLHPIRLQEAIHSFEKLHAQASTSPRLLKAEIEVIERNTMDSRALRIMKALHIENVTNPCSGNTQKIENKAVLPQPAYKSIKKVISRNGEVWRPCPYEHDTYFKIIGETDFG